MIKGNSILFYDGSFDGLLTVIFTAFEQKLEVTGIFPEQEVQQDFFSTPEFVATDLTKAERVRNGLSKKITASGFRQVYFSFLSELRNIELKIYQYCRQAFTIPEFSSKDYGNPLVLEIAQTAKKVGREKHRMEAFVRFRLTKDNIYFAEIEPDFHVLPVILKHFESRYADQKWLIYDVKRKIGIYYDLDTTEYVNFENYQIDKNSEGNLSIFDKSESDFQLLWQNYFNSVNIQSRKNTKLHLQHVPKRYWKYLSEKRPLHK